MVSFLSQAYGACVLFAVLERVLMTDTACVSYVLTSQGGSCCICFWICDPTLTLIAVYAI
jgi:hypothetical protein